jgi:hypothetical protein
MPTRKSPTNVKKFSKKSVEKVQYASKVVGKIIDEVVETKLSTIKKNPKTVRIYYIILYNYSLSNFFILIYIYRLLNGYKK